MKKNNILGVIFILFFATIVLMFTKNYDIQQQNDKLKQQIINTSNVSKKSLDSCLKYLVNYLYMNNNESYAKLNGKYTNFVLYGVKTIPNYKTEKNLNNFRGTTSGVTAQYEISKNTSCKVYIIENMAHTNGNMIFSDTLQSPTQYYSLYKIGNYYLKINVSGDIKTLPSSDYDKIYRFTSQLVSSIQTGINNYSNKS